MTPPSASARQAAVDAAAEEMIRGNEEEGFEPPPAEQVVAKVFATLAGDLFIDEVGVRDGQGRLHLVRDDTTDQLWALLEAILLPTRDAGEAL